MAQLNPTQQQIVKAFEQYKAGSTGVVRAFEATLSHYWGEGSCNPAIVSFFIEVSKRFPVLQKVAIGLLNKKGADALGYFEIKKTKTGFAVRNFAGKDKDGNEIAITKEMKATARANLRKFIASEYTSLMHEKSVKMDVKFDSDQAAKSIKASIVNNMKKMLTENGDADVAFLRGIAEAALREAFAEASIAKVKADIAKAKAA